MPPSLAVIHVVYWTVVALDPYHGVASVEAIPPVTSTLVDRADQWFVQATTDAEGARTYSYGVATETAIGRSPTPSDFRLQTLSLTQRAVGRLRYIEAQPAASMRPRGTLVFLHAFPLNARMWEPQFALAERGWRLIAPQFRGFDGAAGGQVSLVPQGETCPPTTMDDYAGDVIDLLDALRVQEAVVCGLSMGGYVAFAMLRHAPRYLQGLILADTRPQADAAEGVKGRERMLQVLEAKGPPAVADEMLPKLLGETTRRERSDLVEHVKGLVLANGAGAIAGALHALKSRPDSTPLLASIHVPTLIVAGEEDTVTPPAVAEEMRRAIAGSDLSIISEAGHLSNLEQAQAFNATVARFLDHRV